MATIPTWTSQDKALALLPKFSGFLSLCGSLYIVQHVLRSRERRGFVYHQILMAMSCSDVLGSSMYVLSTWPIPRGDAVFAVGNQATCNAQGTLDQFASLTTPLFTGSLSIYYLLVIRYGWREEQVQRHRHWFFVIPFAMGVTTALAGLGLELYNSADWVCWIAAYPPGCNKEDSDVECTRGIHADLYRMVFSYVIVWIVFGVLAISMAMIYQRVWQTERKTIRFRGSSYLQGATTHLQQTTSTTAGDTVEPSVASKIGYFCRRLLPPRRLQRIPVDNHHNNHHNENDDDSNDDDDSNRDRGHDRIEEQDDNHSNTDPQLYLKRHPSSGALRTRDDTPTRPPPTPRNNNHLSRTVLYQALMYCGAFYLTFLFGTIARILQIWDITAYPVFVCMTIFFPLQGFWQFLIYTRPSRNKKKKQCASNKSSSSVYTNNPLLCIDCFHDDNGNGSNNNHRSGTNSSSRVIANENDDDQIVSPSPRMPSTRSMMCCSRCSVSVVDTRSFLDAQSELEYINQA
ncbi:expressed unknown protein [Seminavis robusta]|uniref:G-protein coupled receptors family 2 profile 2 domain-containing protein n=1 Tax=Seminavis robusta TaxID=568900 RepID=A0A9N8HV48_9STRA|nr:expressed unknown protein [Seminavis robusta]|eukprot:Sro1927_g305960.1 n/a (515) ;mRNA; r:16212-17756